MVFTTKYITFDIILNNYYSFWYKDRLDCIRSLTLCLVSELQSHFLINDLKYVVSRCFRLLVLPPYPDCVVSFWYFLYLLAGLRR
jgi:hypothetical protein